LEIVIKNREFDESMTESVEQAFRQIINQLQELNLDSLQFIIVPDVFGEELIEFQRSRGLREGYTNNEFGTAFGMKLSYLEDGNHKSSIFLDPRVVFTLFDENLIQNSVHIIHHELGHVHDDAYKFQIFGVTDLEELFMNTSDRVSQVTYAHADLIWSEYIATRLSARSKPEDHDLYVPSIISLVHETKVQCDELILAYRTEGDVGRLFGEIQLTTSLLLKIAAYFIGYCHGLNIEPPEEMNNFIKQYAYWDGVWEELSPLLRKLHDSYGNWNDVYVFEDLAQTVKKLWGNLGVYPKNMDDGQLFISVPY